MRKSILRFFVASFLRMTGWGPNRKRTLYFTLFIAFLFVIGCGNADNSIDSNQESALETVPAEYAGMTNPLGSDAAGEGAKVYKDYCASCHGETGKGDGAAGASLEPKPKDLSQLSVLGDDYLFWRISQGKEGTAMIGWNGALNEEQVWQVVSFIRTLK